MCLSICQVFKDVYEPFIGSNVNEDSKKEYFHPVLSKLSGATLPGIEALVLVVERTVIGFLGKRNR